MDSYQAVPTSKMSSLPAFGDGTEAAMLLHIAWFEIRYWLRSWMLWIFTFIIATLIFGAVSSDQVQVGGALSNTFRNAPYVIENYYAIIGLLTVLMVTA